MKAIDTVLSPERLDKLAEENPLLDFSFEDDYQEEVKLMREAQAEETERLLKPQWIQEVLDLLNYEWGNGACYFYPDKVIAQLKEWGVENE